MAPGSALRPVDRLEVFVVVDNVATIDDLARFRLGRIVPAHCTGYRAVHRLIDRFGDIVIPSAVGGAGKRPRCGEPATKRRKEE